MDQQGFSTIILSLPGDEGDRWQARLGPQDRPDLETLLGGRSEGTLEVRLGAGQDTEGHVVAASADVELDVEGHTLTLRLPSVEDATALRRRLALGAVAVTIVAGGSAAAMSLTRSSHPAAEPLAAPLVQTSPVRERLLELELQDALRPAVTVGSVVPGVTVTSTAGQSAVRERLLELERQDAFRESAGAALAPAVGGEERVRETTDGSGPGAF